MKLYGSSMSPFVRKVLVFCAEKEIIVDSQPVGIGSTDEGFRAASPFGKMPALVHGDYAVADSSAIVHYLEAKQPEPVMIPAEAQARGKVIWFEEFADTILTDVGRKLFFNRIVAPVFLGKEGDLAAAERAEHEELPPVLDYLERELAGREYLVGEQLTLADVAVASSLANLEHAGVVLGAEGRPNLAAYKEKMLKRPSFSALLERERAYLARVRA